MLFANFTFIILSTSTTVGGFQTQTYQAKNHFADQRLNNSTSSAKSFTMASDHFELCL